MVLELRGDEEALERASTFLFDRGCLGTEEIPEDPRPGLKAYFPPGVGVELESIVGDLARAVPDCEARVEAPLPSRDWLAEWKRSLSGFPLGERFYVVPTWLESPEVTRSVLRIDPEQAFGTGTHETTRLCAELLERYVEPETEIVDIGTGTGILAMIAARLGASRILAIEPDAAAWRCARANVTRNGLGDRVDVRCRSWDASLDVANARLAVANITSTVLEGIVDQLEIPMLILSGILASELDAFAGALPDRYAVVETRVAGEWAALVAKRR